MKRRALTVTCIDYDVKLARPLSCSTCAVVAQELVKHLLFMRGQAPALIDELAAQMHRQVWGVTGLQCVLRLHKPQRKADCAHACFMQALTGPDATPDAAGHRRRPAVDRKLQKVASPPPPCTSCMVHSRPPAMGQKRAGPASQFISMVEGIAAALTPTALQHSTCILFLLGPSPLRPMEAYSLHWPTARVAAGDEVDAWEGEQAEQPARDASRRVLRSLIIHTASEQEGTASAGRDSTSLPHPQLCMPLC